MSEFILNTGRTISQGMFMESDGKWSDKYFNAVAYAEMNPEDIKRLGIDGYAKITSSVGSIVVAVRPSDRVAKGSIFIPMGPVANFLLDGETDGVGIPSYKAVKVKVEPTKEKPTTLADILKALGAKGLDIVAEDIPVKTGEKRVVENVVCPFCGDLCDFLRIEVDGNKITRNVGGCSISIAKFLNYHKHRILKPYIRVGGKLT